MTCLSMTTTPTPGNMTCMEPTLVSQPSKRPTNKLTAAGAAGSASVVIVWLAGLVGVDMPAEVGAAVATLLSFAAGYLVKDRANQ